MDKFEIDKIREIDRLESELELERAQALYNKLRLLVKDDPSLKPVRSHLADLIEAYESAHWKEVDKVDDERYLASERAEKLVHARNVFVQRRKDLIRKKLKINGLNQNDLADILGHGKGYMSELINGIRPLSKDDLVIIHKILGIRFKDLIETTIKEPRLRQLQQVLQEKQDQNPGFKLNSGDLEPA